MGCVNLVASFRRKYIYLIDTRFLSSRCFAPLLPLLLCAWRSVILISSTLDKMLLGTLVLSNPPGFYFDAVGVQFYTATHRERKKLLYRTTGDLTLYNGLDLY